MGSSRASPLTVTFYERTPPPGQPMRNMSYRTGLLTKVKLREGGTLELGDLHLAPAGR